MKALKRIVLGSLLFFVVLLLAACGQNQTTGNRASDKGKFVVEIILSGDDPATEAVETEYVKVSKEISYKKGDTLMELLRTNFTVYCGGPNGENDESCSYDSGFGRYLNAIDVLDSSSVTNGYISFYIDGDYAMTGVDATKPENGKVYSFKLETF